MARRGMDVAGNELTVQGEMLQVGQPAPDFTLTANNWQAKTLADYTGKIKIISIVPSLDTRVCATQTRRFNQEASNLSDDTVVLTVSADLPYAQRRWCAAEGIDRVETLSDHKTMNFSTAFGVNVVDLRICQRSVFVLDRENIVRHAEYVYMMGDEPDYEAALAAARALV
ncbi:MAG: thiol peroxidase [Anaerolineae bacterium]|nr:thiol peroxidase [Anaerolineae bacterium]